ncbi:MAG: FAD-dependent oxidoreductase [Gammaproteobacteria bacterium]|nr:FAD-dependent oxidoreductase [Gammaproteobacteria bacterium]
MYQWAVIGAGPAGIAAVGKLLDNGVAAKDLVWIDPQFCVGDFGTKWRNVPSNTKVKLFTRFLHASPAFNYAACAEDFALNFADPNANCYLNLMADPLQWVTHHLQSQVFCIKDTAEELFFQNQVWHIHLQESIIQANNVILAVGSEPKHLEFSSVKTLSLQEAMDHEYVKNHINKEDTIAVFGSSHSAILAIRNLVDAKVKRVINFYRSPLLYAVYYDDWILYDDTGLKGSTAEWARQHIDGQMPDNLERVFSDDENIEKFLPQCDRAVYAVGFERRSIKTNVPHLNHTEHDGKIAPGLYGIGIAYPEAKANRLGTVEYRVGLWKFMEYLQRVVPVWVGLE